MNRLKFSARFWVMAASLWAVAAMAAPKPMVLSTTYPDLISPDLKLPKGTKTCRVAITEITDRRLDPTMIGVHDGRAIHAPDDPKAWLRSVLGALKSRKLEVTFGDGGPSDQVAAKFELTKSWIANTNSNMSASIVFHVQAQREGALPLDQVYRGGASHMPYWSNGPGELQRAMDTAISRVLDAMATDLHKLCGTQI